MVADFHDAWVRRWAHKDYGGFVVNVGETAVVACVAQDMKAAGIVHRLMRGYLKESPLLSEELVNERRDALVLRNGIEVRVFPCTSKAIYGYSVPAGGMDELGRFKFEGSADSDVDIQASIYRGQVNYPRAKLFKVSTPSGRDGVLYQDFQQSHGKNDPDRLVWQLSSERMNPDGVDPAFLARMRTRLDPMRYARLFDAEFSEDVGVFLPGHLVEAAVATGVTMRPPESGRKYVAAVDASEGGDDAFAMAIAFADGEQIVQVYGQAWEKPKTRTMDLNATVEGIAATLTRYGVKRVYGDRLTGQWIVEAFKRHGIEYVHPTIRRQGDSVYVTRSLAYLEAGPLFRTGAIKILDDSVTCRELRNLELHGDKVDHPSGYHDDRANALCLAAVMAAERARVSESFAGVTSVTKSFVGDGSAGRLGTDQSMVHPHERIERETTEADERMGAAKAARWRRAWGGS